MSGERTKRRALVAIAVLAIALVVFFAVLSSETDLDPESGRPDRKRAEIADPGVVHSDAPVKEEEAIDLLAGPDPFADVAPTDPEAPGELLVEVRRANGARVLGAVVHAAGTKQKTDEDGYALFAGLEPAAKYFIEARGPDFYDSPAKGAIGVSAGCRSEIRIVVARGGAVRGRLVTPDGRPVNTASAVGVYLSANGFGGWPQRNRALAWAEFGPGGRFELRGVRPGTAYVHGAARWHTAVVSSALEILPEKTTKDVVLVLRPAGRLSGRVVVRGTAKPIAGAFLNVFSPTGGQGFAKSGKDGFFEFQGLPSGSYRLSASSRGHGFEKTLANATMAGIRVEAGKENANLLVEIGPGGSMVGALHGLEGNAARGVRLCLLRELPGVPLDDSPDQLLSRRPTGEFAAKDLEPGNYVLRAMDMRGQIVAEARFRVHEGAESRVDLRPGTPRKDTGGTISGVVLGVDGRPLVKARVYLIAQPGTEGYGHTQSTADGRFTITVAKPGKYAVAAMVSNGLGRSAVLTIEVGKNVTDVEIRLSPTFDVVLTAKHRSGNVAKRVYLTLRREPDHRVMLYSGVWGRSATRLLPGRWRIYAGRIGNESAEPVDTIEVKATGRTQAFDVTID